MQIVQTESSAHWYRPNGEPFHTCKTADGKSMRSTTLRDARKVSALPSVTTILGVLHKPQLETWKITQAILAALTLPRKPDEDLQDFAKRAAEDAKAEVRASADKGQDVHSAVENYLRSGRMPTDPFITSLFLPAKKWLDENVCDVLHTEQVLVNQAEGFAGTVDIVARLKSTGKYAVIDAKTNKGKTVNGKWTPYFSETWPLQMEGYRRSIITPEGMPVTSVSLIINSLEACPVQAKVWDESEYEAQWAAFKNCRDIWIYLRKYDPRKP